jgi:hypothetical protein
MSKVQMNMCVNDNNNLLETIDIDEERVVNIDDARLLVVHYLRDIYLDIRYKIRVCFNINNCTSKIDVIFDDDIALQRKYKLNKLLDD